jgi:hypothetical protein
MGHAPVSGSEPEIQPHVRPIPDANSPADTVSIDDRGLEDEFLSAVSFKPEWFQRKGLEFSDQPTDMALRVIEAPYQSRDLECPSDVGGPALPRKDCIQ